MKKVTVSTPIALAAWAVSFISCTAQAWMAAGSPAYWAGAKPSSRES